MIEESISWVSISVYTEPLPALNKGRSSKIMTAEVTASRLVPPFSSTLYPASRAWFIPLLYELRVSSSRPEKDPAPPCTIKPKLFTSSFDSTMPTNRDRKGIRIILIIDLSIQELFFLQKQRVLQQSLRCLVILLQQNNFHFALIFQDQTRLNFDTQLVS